MDGWTWRLLIFILLKTIYSDALSFLLLWRQITIDDLRGGLVGAHWCPAFCVAVINIWGSPRKRNRGSSCLFHKVYLPPPTPMEPPGPLRQYLKYWNVVPPEEVVLMLICLPCFCSVLLSVPLSPSFVSQAQPLCWLFFCSSGFICFKTLLLQQILFVSVFNSVSFHPACLAF